MIKNKILFFLTLCFSVYANAQHKISIKNFESKTIAQFDDGQNITRHDVNDEGFQLEIAEIHITEIKEKNRTGNFIPKTKDSVSNTYKFIKPFIDADNCIVLRVFKSDSDFKEIEIMVESNESTGGGSQSQGDDGHTRPPSSPECECCTEYSTAKDKFGINAKDFDEKDIIYVYDFNKDVRKRRLYKVTFKNGISSSKVNLTTDRLRGREQVYFMINGINRFMYNVVIEDTLINNSSDPGFLLRQIFIGDSSAFLVNLIGKVAQSRDANIAPIKKNIDSFLDQYAKLKSEVINIYDPCYNFKCCNNSTKFEKLFTLLDQIKADIRMVKAEKFPQLANKRTEYKNCIENNEKNNKLNDEIKKLKDEIKKLKADEKPTEEKEAELKNKITEQVSLKDKICSDDTVTYIKNQILELTIDSGRIAELDTIASRLPTEEKLRNIAIILLNMVDQNNNYWKGPIQLRGDALDVTIKINSSDSVDKYLAKTKFTSDMHFVIPVVWKSFVSFSSGSFITLGNYLQNISYNWKQIPVTGNIADSTYYVLEAGGYSSRPLGLSALANVGWRFGKSFGLGLSAGAGLTIEEKPKIAYLGGGSFVIGDQRQLVLTAGFAGMQVDKLTSQFEEIVNQQTIYRSNQTTIQYYKEFKVGAFISVTYTLIKPFKYK